MKKEIEQYIHELEHQINFQEKRKAEAYDKDDVLVYAASSEAAFQLNMVIFRLQKILHKALQQQHVQY